ncbi:hypothetical protein [Sphingobacterium sp. UDSM-2020]|uniref:hypothetical protein n=1 Tax=Sphingobacterium sp. UDSM-2020 TaxID=2795738 RepID=UPI001938BB62|nr:hypothetical protein [Sphingobacterium sp. UDSM-2020]QQD14272.1 hypothetical protein JAZ75_01615 [Sphingobacterium sp. UDSM-2020]
MMNVLERAQAPTPKFFKVLRSVGIIVATIGGAILTAPISLPATLISIGGYLTVAGGVISAISQITVDDKRVDKGAEGVNDE